MSPGMDQDIRLHKWCLKNNGLLLLKSDLRISGLWLAFVLVLLRIFGRKDIIWGRLRKTEERTSQRREYKRRWWLLLCFLFRCFGLRGRRIPLFMWVFWYESLSQCWWVAVDCANYCICFLWLVFLYPHLDDIHVCWRHLQGQIMSLGLLGHLTHVSRSMLPVHSQVFASLEMSSEASFLCLEPRCSKIYDTDGLDHFSAFWLLAWC